MEAIMYTVYKSHDFIIWKPEHERNAWYRFTAYDMLYPGESVAGSVHFAPNSAFEYDWWNTRKVYSAWRDWRDNYPNLKGEKELISRDAWNNGGNLDHKTWWLSCIPHVNGRDEKGYNNNWWDYYQNFMYTTALEIQVNSPPRGSGTFKIDGITSSDFSIIATLTTRERSDVTTDSVINVEKDETGSFVITAWRDGVSAKKVISPPNTKELINNYLRKLVKSFIMNRI